MGTPEQLRTGVGDRGFVEAAHEPRRLGFVLTLVVFHVVFNHIVITKHRDHFLPSASLCRVLGCGCAKLSVQTLLHEPCSLRHPSTHAEAGGSPLAPGKLWLRLRVQNPKAGPTRSPPQGAELQVIQREPVFPEQIILIPTPS